MKKSRRTIPAQSRKLTAGNIASLVEQVRRLVQSARSAAAASVNTLQVITNFEIGRRIVEHEQQGAARAKYGKGLLGELSLRLTEELGSGFSERNLRSFRLFYRTYQGRSIQNWQKPSANSALEQKSQTPSGKSAAPFILSWSHYVLLLTIKNPDERSLYEIEATQSGWSLPELKRQVNSGLYERLALSRNKKQVRLLAQTLLPYAAFSVGFVPHGGFLRAPLQPPRQGEL